MSFPDVVKRDVDAGFIISDPDDGWQRYKKLNETTFVFKCEVNGATHEEEINVDDIDHKNAIDGYYDSVNDVIEQYGDDANLIIAECEFENSCPMLAYE
jgi:hypothetical protein